MKRRTFLALSGLGCVAGCLRDDGGDTATPTATPQTTQTPAANQSPTPLPTLSPTQSPTTTTSPMYSIDRSATIEGTGMAREVNPAGNGASKIRFRFSFDVTPAADVDVFVMPADRSDRLRPGGDLFRAAREERLSYIRANAIRAVTFIDSSYGRGETEVSAGTYWLELSRVANEAEEPLTVAYRYQVYPVRSDE